MEKDIILIFKNRMEKIKVPKIKIDLNPDPESQLQNMFFLGQARFSFFVLHALNFIKAS